MVNWIAIVSIVVIATIFLLICLKFLLEIGDSIDHFVNYYCNHGRFYECDCKIHGDLIEIDKIFSPVGKKVTLAVTMVSVSTFLLLFCVGALIYIGFKHYSSDSPEVSKEAEKLMNWYEAVVYCQDLDENGHSDWKLPKTHELVALSKSNGGYWASDNIDELNKNKEHANGEEKVWLYDFENNKIDKSYVSTNMHVVCVRNMPKTEEPTEDTTEEQVDNACLHARKTQADHTWMLYLEKFPNGICAQEAKDALDKIACEKADGDPLAENDQNNETDKIQVTRIKAWKSYLEAFPNGRCVKYANQKICDSTQQLNSIENWKTYLNEFPEGQCAEEAKQKICDLTRAQNSITAWKKYLKDFPDGKCAFEAEDEIKHVQSEYIKERTVGELVWSDSSKYDMNWGEAKRYCINLDEGGYDDWRLPDIDELRILIQNHSGTRTGGSCRISQKEARLSSSDRNSDCNGRSGSNFCKLQNTNNGYLWSSSTVSNGYDSAWRIGCSDAEINYRSKSDYKYTVNCVRDLNPTKSEKKTKNKK